jgi:hypothetical protein
MNIKSTVRKNIPWMTIKIEYQGNIIEEDTLIELDISSIEQAQSIKNQLDDVISDIDIYIEGQKKRTLEQNK